MMTDVGCGRGGGGGWWRVWAREGGVTPTGVITERTRRRLIWELTQLAPAGSEVGKGGGRRDRGEGGGGRRCVGGRGRRGPSESPITPSSSPPRARLIGSTPFKFLTSSPLSSHIPLLFSHTW